MFRLAFTLSLLAVSLAAQAQRDEKADKVAHLMMDAMGGEEAWKKAHFVRFDFRVIAGGNTIVSRSHMWDKMTGRYRLEDKTKDGKPRTALFNVKTQKGDVYVSGKKLEGKAAEDAVKAAYAIFVNDEYWLAMPWKWFDPGVNLKYAGDNGKDDIIQLSFDHVGLTPGDRYQVFVSRRTRLMEHWSYVLQNGIKGQWDWFYTTTGGVKLASNHTSEDGKQINMGAVQVTDKADDSMFTNSEARLLNP
jgi:hypothetical protein